MIVQAIERLVERHSLGEEESRRVMEEIFSGSASDAQIGAFLTALRMKGETVDELVGMARAMRAHAKPISLPGASPGEEALVDTCGTGGDGAGTFNVSTAAALVVSGAGVRVAKHGNRSISSRCGSADVLEALGVRLDLAAERAAESIEQVGFGFLFAPAIHTAMHHAQRARRDLRLRTVFNLLGPLTNPANASAQLIGVSQAPWTELVAAALNRLGIRRAFVVHGADGLDELTITAETQVSEVSNSTIRSFRTQPEDFGLRRAPGEALRGGDTAENARIIRAILSGEKGPRRDLVLMNASAALVAAGRAGDFLEGVAVARASIDSGAARAKLDQLIAFTNEGKTENRK
ncbi:MAG TPA: anthranilate phosphoribosyltransferase [Candidatus Acidoferrales bacterium]